MKSTRPILPVFFVLVFALDLAWAQQPNAAPAATVPTLVKFSGVAQDTSGHALIGKVGVTFALYKEQQGGAALWLETQNVTADASGHYDVILGASRPEGLPLEGFTSGEARWLGVSVNGEREQPRVLLLSVPYALKAKDAETVGGLPPTAFMLAAPPAATTDTTANASAGNSAPASPSVTGSGTVNTMPLWMGAASPTTTLGNSAITQTGNGATAKVGINTTAPSFTLDVHGGTALRGLLFQPAQGTATAAAGFVSQAHQMVASAFNSTTKTAVNQNFVWRVEPVSNNTANPSGTLNLLFGTTSSLAETGLHIASNGQITFAKGQMFPGTGPGTVKSVSFSAPASDFTVSGSPVTTSGTLGLNWKVAPTDASTANAIVKRDAFGNFSTNSISAGTGIFNDVFNTGEAIFASSSQPGATTVTGQAIATTGVGFGVLGETSSTDAKALGVYGFADATTGNAKGVKGFAASSSGTGVYGDLVGPSSVGLSFGPAGVWGDSGVEGVAGVLATADNGHAIFAENNSGNNPDVIYPTVVIGNENAAGLVFEAFGPGFNNTCTIDAHSNLACTGTVSGAISVSPGSKVALSAIESPENWFEDFGSAQLVNGSATVPLEPIFAQTVNTGVGYHVFLTANGDCKGLYVSQKSATAFEVRELGSGTSNISFDYRIVAKRKGYEKVRLADMTKSFTPHQLTGHRGSNGSSARGEFRLEKVGQPVRPSSVTAPKK